MTGLSPDSGAPVDNSPSFDQRAHKEQLCLVPCFGSDESGCMGYAHRRHEELSDALELLRADVTDKRPVFRIRDAEGAGVPKPIIQALVRDDRLHRIRHGAYVERDVWTAAETDPPAMRRLLVLAALTGLREPAFAHGAHAAELHGLPLAPGFPERLELVRQANQDRRPAATRGKDRNRIEGLHILTRDIRSEQVTQRQGVPVISLSSAAITTAARFSPEYAVAVLDNALRQGVESFELHSVIGRWAAGRGVIQVGRLVEFARSGAESPLESISRFRLMARGVPEPELQHEFFDGRGFVARVDFWWPKLKVVGEADGMAKYTEITDVRAEKLRQDRLSALGLTVVRWTWQEIWERPGDVARRILASHR